MSGLLIFDLNGTLIHEKDKCRKDQKVRLRPGGKDFLQKCLSDGWTLAIWSASNKKWVQSVIDENFSEFPFLFLWSKEQCFFLKKEKVFTKPLARVWEKYPCFSKKNTFIYDNKPHNFLFNPQNGILVPTFQN